MAYKRNSGKSESTATVDDILSKYQSEDFTTGAAVRPHCQWHNHQTYGGLLLKEQFAEAVDFDTALAEEFGGYQWMEKTFGESPEEDESQEAVQCLVTPSPTLIIVRRGQLKMYRRGDEELVGSFERSKYSATRHVLKTRYLVFLLIKKDKSYVLLHQEPLILTLKGSIGAQFGKKDSWLEMHEKSVAQHFTKSPPFAFALHLGTESEQVTDQATGEIYWMTNLKSTTAGAYSKSELESRFIGEDALLTAMGAWKGAKKFD